jgi:dual specificity phosphatase 12
MACPADEVVPGLFIGSRRMITDNTDWLTAMRIDVVISALTRDEYDEYMITYSDFDKQVWYSLEIDDEPGAPIYSHFDHAHRIIRNALTKGNRVLVHCAAGVSRSVSLVAAYLIIEKSMTADAALRLIRSNRVNANPNDGFRKQLALLERMVAASPCQDI